MALERMALVLGRWILRIMVFYIAYSIAVYIFVMLIQHALPLIFLVGLVVGVIKWIECASKDSVWPFMEVMIVWPFRITFQLIKLPWKISDNFTREVADRVPDKMGFVFLASTVAACAALAPLAITLTQRTLEAMSVLIQALTESRIGGGGGSW